MKDQVEGMEVAGALYLSLTPPPRVTELWITLFFSTTRCFLIQTYLLLLHF